MEIASFTITDARSCFSPNFRIVVDDLGQDTAPFRVVDTRDGMVLGAYHILAPAMAQALDEAGYVPLHLGGF